MEVISFRVLIYIIQKKSFVLIFLCGIYSPNNVGLL